MGYRIRITRHISLGSSGPRIGGNIGRLRISTGTSGSRFAIGRLLYWAGWR